MLPRSFIEPLYLIVALYDLSFFYKKIIKKIFFLQLLIQFSRCSKFCDSTVNCEYFRLRYPNLVQFSQHSRGGQWYFIFHSPEETQMNNLHRPNECWSRWLANGSLFYLFFTIDRTLCCFGADASFVWRHSSAGSAPSGWAIIAFPCYLYSVTMFNIISVVNICKRA